jgi:Zn-dependent protease with chaperone function
MYWIVSLSIFAFLNLLAIALPVGLGIALGMALGDDVRSVIVFVAAGLAGFLALVTTVRTLSISFSRFGHLPGQEANGRTLRGLVDGVCDTLGVDRFKRIRATPFPNCGTAFAPGGRVLEIGLPDLKYLTKNEVVSVVAHECAHYDTGAMLPFRAHYQNTLWFEGLKECIRLSMSSSRKAFAGAGKLGAIAYLLTAASALVLKVLLGVYSLYISLVDRLLRSPEREFHCDAVACEITGTRVFKSALLKGYYLWFAHMVIVQADVEVSAYPAALDGTYRKLCKDGREIVAPTLKSGSYTHPSYVERERRAPQVSAAADASPPILTAAAARSLWASLERSIVRE